MNKFDKTSEQSSSEQQTTPQDYVDGIYTKISGNGRFNWLFAFPVGFGYWFGLGYMIPFLTLMPKFEWSFNGGLSWYQCDSVDVCSGNANLLYHVNNNSNFTIQNWITRMNLYWISKFELGLFGSLYFLGFVFGALTLLRLGDIFGRKPIWLFTSISLLFVYLIFYFVENLYLIYFFIFIWGT